MSTANAVEARYTTGTVSPIGTDRHPMSQPQPLLPPDIRRISCSIEISDYTTEGVEEAIRERYWKCVDELVQQGANSITLAGFPIASQLGGDRVLELADQTAKRHPRGRLRQARRHKPDRTGVATHRGGHRTSSTRLGAAAC